ncbi:MAG: hypothetical protein ACNFW9_05645 [Candidatus Kerfeldbacteria bacterium]
MMKLIINNQSGYIALIAVLIIVVVTLSIGLSLNSLSIGETQNGLIIQQSIQSQAVAESCLHEAYWQLRQDSGYTSGSLNIGQGSCTITVMPSSPDYIITSEANVNEVISKYESNITINGNNITVNSWERLTN